MAVCVELCVELLQYKWQEIAAPWCSHDKANTTFLTAGASRCFLATFSDNLGWEIALDWGSGRSWPGDFCGDEGWPHLALPWENYCQPHSRHRLAASNFRNASRLTEVTSEQQIDINGTRCVAHWNSRFYPSAFVSFSESVSAAANFECSIFSRSITSASEKPAPRRR